MTLDNGVPIFKHEKDIDRYIYIESISMHEKVHPSQSLLSLQMVFSQFCFLCLLSNLILSKYHIHVTVVDVVDGYASYFVTDANTQKDVLVFSTIVEVQSITGEVI